MASMTDDQLVQFSETLQSGVDMYLLGFSSVQPYPDGVIIQDLSVAAESFRRLRAEHGINDQVVEELMHLRLVIEAAIRLTWIAAFIDSEPFTVDSRAWAMRKGDLIAFRTAIFRVSGGAERAQADGLDEAIKTIDGAPAPSTQMAQLAKEANVEGLYVGHRMCSSIVHLGAGIGRSDLMPREVPLDMAVSSMMSAWSMAIACLAALRGRYPADWPGVSGPIANDWQRLVSRG